MLAADLSLSVTAGAGNCALGPDARVPITDDHPHKARPICNEAGGGARLIDVDDQMPEKRDDIPSAACAWSTCDDVQHSQWVDPVPTAVLRWAQEPTQSAARAPRPALCPAGVSTRTGPLACEALVLSRSWSEKLDRNKDDSLFILCVDSRAPASDSLVLGRVQAGRSRLACSARSRNSSSSLG